MLLCSGELELLWGVALGSYSGELELLWGVNLLWGGKCCSGELLWEEVTRGKECGSEFIMEIKKHVHYSSTCFKKVYNE